MRNVLCEHRNKVAIAVFSVGTYASQQMIAPLFSATIEQYPTASLGLQITLPLCAGIAGWWYASAKIPYLTVSESALILQANREIEAGELFLALCMG
ncbi:MAG: hypothetical protein WC222_04300 [Parachlamydiales bacterium]|jgi:hypothetical protein